jgi:hypothetical protein
MNPHCMPDMPELHQAQAISASTSYPTGSKAKIAWAAIGWCMIACLA